MTPAKESKTDHHQTSNIPFRLDSDPLNHLPFSSNSSPAPPAPPPSLLRLASCASCTVLIFRACIGVSSSRSLSTCCLLPGSAARNASIFASRSADSCSRFSSSSTVGRRGRLSEGLEDLGCAADCRSVIMRSRLAISEGRVSSWVVFNRTFSLPVVLLGGLARAALR